MSNVVVDIPFDRALKRLQGERLFSSSEEAVLFKKLASATLPVQLRPFSSSQTKISTHRIWERGEDEEAQYALLKLAEALKAPYRANKIKQRLLKKRSPKTAPTPFSSPREILKMGGINRLLPQGEGVLEIGCGNGEFLVQLMAEGKTALGLEISNRCLRKAAFRLREAGITETRRYLVKSDGVVFLRWLVPQSFLKEIYLLFPDPWDGNPQRRIVTKGFLELVRERLVVGGRMFMATDHPEYARQMERVILNTEGIEPVDWESPLGTKYHRKWLAQGRPTHRFSFVVKRHLDELSEQNPLLDLEVESPAIGTPELPMVLSLEHEGHLIIERSYQADEGRLFKTILNPPWGMAQKQFLLLKKDKLILLPTWHEIVTPSLLKAVSLFASGIPSV